MCCLVTAIETREGCNDLIAVLVPLYHFGLAHGCAEERAIELHHHGRLAGGLPLAAFWLLHSHRCSESEAEAARGA